MTTHEERQRLAAAANALRPDWPVNSLYTLLTHEVIVKRAYRDVAQALAWIATDPDTHTPARMHEPGPWWDRGRTPATQATHRMDDAVLCAKCGVVHTSLSPCAPPETQRSHSPEQSAQRAAAARAALRGDAS